MGNREDKPKRSSFELVEMLRDKKGIRFELINETEAQSYLTDCLLADGI
ncbi:MAG: hypothetical protein IKS66_02985 [Oscillospiraceae bacterium]|nr:hypothetical protein [Oscillospiraceae bacterium]